jgi:hypothetical protein
MRKQIGVVITIILGSLISCNSARSQSIPTQNNELQEQLSNISNKIQIEKYQLQPPKGYTLTKLRMPELPAGTPPGVESTGIAFIGSKREDGTYAQLLYSKMGFPLEAMKEISKKISTEQLLSNRLKATENLHKNWYQSKPNKVTINGITFLHSRWNAINKQTGYKCYGFLYVAKIENEFIYLSSQDTEKFHKEALALADASVHTLEKHSLK